jgi:hypothetical protein
VNPVARAAATCVFAGLAWAPSARAWADESRFLAPASGEILASGVAHEIRWTPQCNRYPDANEMELLLSVDGGRTFSIRVTAELPACASSFRWKVPALSTNDARLAVRVGRDGEESERIAFVSPPFRITSFAPAAEPELTTGTSERWTEQALSEIGAENLLGDAMHGAPERIGAPVADSELDEPPSGLRTTWVDSYGKRPASGEGCDRCAVRPTVPRLVSFLPLRE